MQYEGKDGPNSPTGGVKAFPIATRFVEERERLAGGFTDEDRAWRHKFLKDQILHPDEPMNPEWLYRERFNPIRRLYMLPLNTLFKPLKRTLSEESYLTVRFGIGRGLLLITALYVGAYWIKYNGNNWTKTGGWQLVKGHPMSYPGTSEPQVKLGKQKGDTYYDGGFKNSPI